MDSPLVRRPWLITPPPSSRTEALLTMHRRLHLLDHSEYLAPGSVQHYGTGLQGTLSLRPQSLGVNIHHTFRYGSETALVHTVFTVIALANLPRLASPSS